MWLSRYFVWFVIYSFMGWIFETVYVTVKNQKWANRGFLYGPICPIYGTGAVAISIIMEVLPLEQAAQMEWWKIFLIAYFGSIVLEYGTSYALEKLFHAYWWDYSNMPLNVHGRICLPASVLFGLAGILVVNVLYPWMRELTGNFPPILMELLALIFMAVIAVDVTLTVSALTNFRRIVESVDNMVNQHMDEFVASMDARIQKTGSRLAEERERFSRETVEKAVSNMATLYRSAVSRVQGIQPQYEGSFMKHALTVVKSKLKSHKSDE